MDKRDVDKAIKQVREEFAAAMKALEAKIDAGGPVEPQDTSAIEARGVPLIRQRQLQEEEPWTSVTLIKPSSRSARNLRLL